MKPIRVVIYVLAVVVSFADLALLYAVRAINDGRIASQTPPLLEIPVGTLLATYALLVAVVFACWWLIRHNVLAGTIGKVGLGILLVFLLARGVVIGYSFWSAPTDRARIAQTNARLGKIDRALQEHLARNDELPEDLVVLGLPNADLHDAWGFRFRYDRDADRLSYQVSAIGVPRDLEGIEIDRRLEGRE